MLSPPSAYKLYIENLDLPFSTPETKLIQSSSWQPSPQPTALLTSLDPFQNYAIRIAAVNAGDGSEGKLSPMIRVRTKGKGEFRIWIPSITK